MLRYLIKGQAHTTSSSFNYPGLSLCVQQASVFLEYLYNGKYVGIVGIYLDVWPF